MPLPALPRLLVSLVVVFGTLVSAFAQESDPEALKIFDAAIARLKANNNALRKWQYYQTLSTRQYDGDGDVIGSASWRSIFRPGAKNPIEYLSETKEGKIDFLKDEPEKPAEPAHKTAPPARETPKPDASSGDLGTDRLESVAQIVRKFRLRDRYIWTLLPGETAAGEDALVIAYEPRPGVSAKTREERLFSLLAGKIWISKADFSVLKAGGGLQSPYRLVWIIARVTKLDFTYEAETDPASRLLRRSKAGAETVVVLPFNTIRQKHSLVVDKYEPRGATVPVPKKAPAAP